MSLTIGDIEQHATDLDAYILAGLDAVALEGEGAEIYRATTGNDGFCLFWWCTVAVGC